MKEARNDAKTHTFNFPLPPQSEINDLISRERSQLDLTQSGDLINGNKHLFRGGRKKERNSFRSFDTEASIES